MPPRFRLEPSSGFFHNGRQIRGGRSSHLEGSAGERIARLLKEGWEQLRLGRPREAKLVFDRVLLRDPSHSEARRGLELARSATAETARDLDLRLAKARAALEAGRREDARFLLERIVEEGPDWAPALVLLDRLDRRKGRIAAPQAEPASVAEAPTARVASAVWLRRALVVGWSLAFGLLAAGVATSWDRLVGGLLEPPVPAVRHAPPVTEIAAPTAAERALTRATRLLQEGDPVGAVAELERVSPDDPAYPFSLRLRLEAQAALPSWSPR